MAFPRPPSGPHCPPGGPTLTLCCSPSGPCSGIWDPFPSFPEPTPGACSLSPRPASSRVDSSPGTEGGSSGGSWVKLGPAGQGVLTHEGETSPPRGLYPILFCFVVLFEGGN